MTIIEQEQQLFKEWKASWNNTDRFVDDGVVDEEAYLKSNRKVLFILKEPVDESIDDQIKNRIEHWDIRDHVREGGTGSTWGDTARWAHGIRELPEIIPWTSYPEVTRKFSSEVLNDVCVMNLKKSPGGSSITWEELKKAATDDAKFIKKQFELYDPDIVICCGANVAWYLDRASKSEIVWETTTEGVEWYRLGKSIVIDYYHPAARRKSSMRLYRLLNAVKEIESLNGK